MAQSSATVFVIVEGDFLPAITSTLTDANNVAVPRAGKTVHLASKPVGGGAVTYAAATWKDTPTNTRPTLAWTSSNDLPLGVYYGRWVTDKDGATRWSFPTEDWFTIVVTAST